MDNDKDTNEEVKSAPTEEAKESPKSSAGETAGGESESKGTSASETSRSSSSDRPSGDRGGDRGGPRGGDRGGPRGGDRGGPRGGDRGGPRGGGRRRFFKKKFCQFCAQDARDVDYKDPRFLRRFITERGKILPRRITGVCSFHQRKLSVAIKRARHLALLAFKPE